MISGNAEIDFQSFFLWFRITNLVLLHVLASGDCFDSFYIFFLLTSYLVTCQQLWFIYVYAIIMIWSAANDLLKGMFLRYTLYMHKQCMILRYVLCLGQSGGPMYVSIPYTKLEFPKNDLLIMIILLMNRRLIVFSCIASYNFMRYLTINYWEKA